MPLATPHPLPPAALGLAAVLACGLPTLLGYNLPPSATLLNQCLAVAAWGLFVVAAAPASWPRVTAPLLGALLLVLLAAGAAVALHGLPASLAWSAQGQLAAAALLVVVGADAAQRAPGQAPAWAAARGLQRPAPHAATALFIGLLVAGLLSALVALVQVFAPDWADGRWIAISGLPGRAVGNLRQPNHLCSLLLWALVAAVALHELRRLPRALLWPVAALLVFAVELTASRTGAVGLGVLLLWGALDRRLKPGTRWLLVALPLLYGLAFAAMAGYGELSHRALGAEARLETGGLGDGSSPNSRANIWRNAWALVLAQPLAGVGFGEFNLAWSLTPFPGRPTAFFDHTHNLPLQLAVELGLPLAALVLLLLGWALWRAARRAVAGQGAAGLAGRAALVLVLVAAVHSMVEYPLWYAYFLLPTALAWGLALGTSAAGGATSGAGAGAGAGSSEGSSASVGAVARAASTTARRWRAVAGMSAGLLMAGGGVFAVSDYLRVSEIYAPSEHSGSLTERIDSGQHSLLFAHHADYAAATNDSPPAAQAIAFQRAPHSLLDTRLMVAWARYLSAQGHGDQARWVAARAREFRNPGTADFFAPCAARDGSPDGAPESALDSVPDSALDSLPDSARDGATVDAHAADAAHFQCQAPRRQHHWREFAQGLRTWAP